MCDKNWVSIFILKNNMKLLLLRIFGQLTSSCYAHNVSADMSFWSTSKVNKINYNMSYGFKKM